MTIGLAPAAQVGTKSDGKYETLYADQEGAPLWGPRPGRLISRIRDFSQGGQVLDAGCGDGKNALELERLGFSVTGIDLCARAVHLLRDRFLAAGQRSQGRYLVGDIESWSPDRPYDVLVSYGLYHCLQPEERLNRHRQLQTCVRPGGIIVFCSLTDGLPMPTDHRTPGITLPDHNEIASLWDGYDVLEQTIGEIVESHPPYVSLHRHEGTWIVARAAA